MEEVKQTCDCGCNHEHQCECNEHKEAEGWRDVEINPNATIPNALPNCTTMAFGLIIADGKKPPVSYIRNAGQWETVLTNGWMAKAYSYDDVEVGDIILQNFISVGIGGNTL